MSGHEAFRFEAKKGWMSLRQPRGDTIVVTAAGVGDVAMAAWLCARLDELTATTAKTSRPGIVNIFDDFERVDHYLTDAKLLLLRWHKKHPQMTSHVLARSRIVAMGVTVARLATGLDLRVYDCRAKWADALAAVSSSELVQPL